MSEETQALAEPMSATFSRVQHARNFALVELKSDSRRFAMSVFLEGGGTVYADRPLLTQLPFGASRARATS